MNIKKDSKFYWSWSVCRLHDNAGVPNLGAFAYLNWYIQARKYGGEGGRSLLGKFFAPSWKNVLDIVQKIWAPPKKIFAPLLSQAGYGPGYIW